MLFLFLIASAYKAYAVPVPLGPDVFSSTPFTLLFGRSPCNCGPQERTLYEVIRGCVLTIIACVYTSLHPNIPDPKATTAQKVVRRLKMAFYMMIAPEAVIWWAMRQWYGAREIVRNINKVIPDLKWTTTHGHFVQMGGLQGILPHGSRRVVNPSYLDAMLKVGWVDPDKLRFPKEQIEDRSKGNFLSKGLVALQTSWFVIECIARFQQHLPITELEVVTLAFAVLNLITYGLWWDKPLNVNCQVEIHITLDPDPVVQPARRQQQDSGSGGDRNEDTQPGHGEDVELVAVGVSGHALRDGDQSTTEPLIPEHSRQRRREARAREDHNQPVTPPPKPTKEKVGNWHRLVVRPFLALVLPIRDMFTCETVEEGVPDVPMFYAYILDQAPLLQIRLITCVIGMIFGGIHFIAWDSHFPTHIELILWRSSSFVIAVVPFLVAALGILLGKTDSDFEWHIPFIDCSFETILLVVRMILFALGPILYILARLCLIVQAFVSLRDIPPPIFQAVAWTSYIPHL